MCGFCGILYTDPDRSIESKLLERMTRIIHHRGPDDEGFFVDGNLALGSRRLSIVGLADGHMPMSSHDGSCWVAYNGELYNHPDIQKKLSLQGCCYRTHSDTESFLHLYQVYGDSFLEHTQGMFGIALWDKTNRKLILGRDRLGIKPVYYHYDGKALRFASELKSILCDPEVPREIDPDALNFYLGYFSAPAPYSMLKGIHKLRPGEMLIFENGELRLKPYWHPERTIHPNPDLTFEDAKIELRECLEHLVQEHLLADVPVGAFLSGGLDSSILVGIMHKFLGDGFKTFSIGFKDHALFDETPHAKAIADQFKTDHHSLLLSSSDLLHAMEEITNQLDEPLADSSCFPVYYVSKLASEHVKVVLSGDGSDEIFAGYRKYLAEYYRKFFSFIPAPVLRGINKRLLPLLPESRAGYWSDLSRQAKKFLRGLDPDPFERHYRTSIHFEDEIRHPLLSEAYRTAMNFEAPRQFRHALYQELPVDELTRMLWVDLRHNLPADMLMKVDRMSMLHSLEVRVPFLDHTLVEYAFSLPGAMKLHGKQGKWIVKEAFKDMLPGNIVYRRKHGFDVPVGEWFKTELRDVIEDVCSEQTTSRRGLFNPQQVRRILQDHQDGVRDYNNQLWIFFSLELWQRRYLDFVR
jgi:asparagine synthase (glutamine-hydrolysing)